MTVYKLSFHNECMDFSCNFLGFPKICKIKAKVATLILRLFSSRFENVGLIPVLERVVLSLEQN